MRRPARLGGARRLATVTAWMMVVGPKSGVTDSQRRRSRFRMRCRTSSRGPSARFASIVTAAAAVASASTASSAFMCTRSGFAKSSADGGEVAPAIVGSWLGGRSSWRRTPRRLPHDGCAVHPATAGLPSAGAEECQQRGLGRGLRCSYSTVTTRRPDGEFQSTNHSGVVPCAAAPSGAAIK